MNKKIRKEKKGTHALSKLNYEENIIIFNRAQIIKLKKHGKTFINLVEIK